MVGDLVKDLVFSPLELKGEGNGDPAQRLARMRESFEKNKNVLAKDYKYFTTPDSLVMPRVFHSPE